MEPKIFSWIFNLKDHENLLPRVENTTTSKHYSLIMKLLVVHVTPKSFEQVLEKVKKLNKKAGPFDHICFIGNLEDDAYPKDVDTTGLPTLYLIGNNKINDCGENIISLNGFGLYECLDRLVIGYVTEDSKQLAASKNEVMELFKKTDAPVDLLITQEWSSGMSRLTGEFYGNDALDEVVSTAEPRYHISYGDNKHYCESASFQWDSTDRVSRFVNIADIDSKNKWAYAFNLNLEGSSQEGASDSQKLIENPYKLKPSKRKMSDSDDNKDIQTTQKKIKTILPSACHFCFTNGNFEDQMVISIGNFSYLTIVKGPLTTPRGEMNFSGHCLLIPIEHIPKLNVGQDDFANSDLVKEMGQYERSVAKMNYIKFDMSTIVFEINSERSIHFHKQIMPIPKFLIMKFKASLERHVNFNNERQTNNAKLNFEECSVDSEDYLKIRNDSKMNYLQFTVYETSEAPAMVYIAKFQPDMRLDMQFGRRVVAYMLRLPKRIKWDSPVCHQTKEQEAEETANFQKGYKEYDIIKS